MDLGFDAVGRSCCTGGVRALTELASARRPSEVVVVSDVDGHHRGQRGAEALANVLAAYCPAVRVVFPPAPFKDARQWVVDGGATGADVAAAIDAAQARRLGVRVRTAGWPGKAVRHAV